MDQINFLCKIIPSLNENTLVKYIIDKIPFVLDDTKGLCSLAGSSLKLLLYDAEINLNLKISPSSKFAP